MLIQMMVCLMCISVTECRTDTSEGYMFGHVLSVYPGESTQLM